MAKKELQFEEAIARLEEVVAKLEAGNVTLDASLAYYEEGMSLIRFCSGKLDEAEARVAVVRCTEQGTVVEPFDGGNA